MVKKLVKAHKCEGCEKSEGFDVHYNYNAIIIICRKCYQLDVIGEKFT